MVEGELERDREEEIPVLGWTGTVVALEGYKGGVGEAFEVDAVWGGEVDGLVSHLVDLCLGF